MVEAAFGVGVPLHVSDFERRMRGNPTRAKAVAQQLEVLLVDEVSMLAAEFLDLLDEQLRALVATFGRGVAAAGKGEKPAKLPAFGGVQLIAVSCRTRMPVAGTPPNVTVGSPAIGSPDVSLGVPSESSDDTQWRP